MIIFGAVLFGSELF